MPGPGSWKLLERTLGCASTTVWVSIRAGSQQGRVPEWMDTLGDCETPQVDEKEVDIDIEEEEGRELMLRLTVNTDDCPPATVLDVYHNIDTGDSLPVMLKRRRQAQFDDQVIDSNVDTMLNAGIIDEGNGAWGFSVVLVRKKDSEVRFCVDYRALNQITKKMYTPCLALMKRWKLYTILVAPEDRDKTAFTTKRGLYRFVRMPFGLTNAPATFQRLMNGVLRGLTWLACLVYLDDIVVFTRGGVERHVVELATVLERLSHAGLTLKLKKCKFATRTMEYLCHELSADNVRPLERLITAVRDFPTPMNDVDAKRFTHLAGYYRKFVDKFGTLIAPITKLLRKSAKWERGEAQASAFQRVKEILIMKPLLIYPDFSLPFRVMTDACKAGLGACLMQDQGKGWQPVTYASKVNSTTESEYGVTELECYAVIWPIKRFRPYLYVTDHAALKWPNLTGKLHRWAITLQEFDFDVEYRPDKLNVVADALSRVPVKATLLDGEGARDGDLQDKQWIP
ncbi:LOW QUALITY PROTEIN: Gag-pol fusion protein [Phytophthora palmivora]|uniref:Gag-pol fusion protein n=1 Tax=Phytophthora palmivora TaxID=4796 RepID=A0A2P4Y7C8_9STRA|nr:LOW QUALITY PROTEIN: Gag-pol fusion protein [Phytophthora palmivora]